MIYGLWFFSAADFCEFTSILEGIRRALCSAREKSILTLLNHAVLPSETVKPSSSLASVPQVGMQLRDLFLAIDESLPKGKPISDERDFNLHLYHALAVRFYSCLQSY